MKGILREQSNSSLPCHAWRDLSFDKSTTINYPPQDNIPSSNGEQQLSKTKIYLSKPQLLPPKENIQIEFDEQMFDTLNDFSPETHRWTATRNGFCKIDLRIKTLPLSSSAKIKTMICINGVVFRHDQVKLSAGQYGKLTLSDTVEIVAGDYLDALIHHDYKDKITLINGSNSTCLIIEESP